MSPLRFGLSFLRRRPLMALLLWSVPELLPAALMGIAVARAVDDGFLAGRPVTGLAWLGAVMIAALAGAFGARQVLRRLADLVEPLRDDLVRRVVSGALANGVTGRPDDGAVTRLARQTEIVRDTFAGLIVVIRSFLVAATGTVAGLLSLSPLLLLFILPPAVLGFAAFLGTLKLAAARLRESVFAEEQLAVTTGTVLAGARDVAATGSGDYALALAATDINRQQNADRAQAAVSALRTVCYAVAAWVPLLLILLGGRWLTQRGLSAGEILGGLTYLLFGFQSALSKLMSGLGNSGLRFLVTLGRILDRTEHPANRTEHPADRTEHPADRAGHPADRAGHPADRTEHPVEQAGVTSPATLLPGELGLRGITFAYGPHSQPVLNGLDLALKPGEHLAVIGPSGIGKSTLAAIVCGLLRPDSGTVHRGGDCVLIPQEAYVFTGTVAENVCYLQAGATFRQSRAALETVGGKELLARLGGLASQVIPAQLSAGERQLIALARAYLSSAPVVLLDEATCHLDPAAERTAEEAFIRQGRTLIVIAHRISSALRAPRVLVLDGAQATLGDHAELASSCALYRDLVISHPAGLLGEPDGLDARTATGLGQHAGQVIANGAVTQEQLRRDVASR